MKPAVVAEYAIVAGLGALLIYMVQQLITATGAFQP